MTWLLKLSNWLSGGALEKYREQARLAKAQLQQSESELINLRTESQQLKIEIEQLTAQLQIGKGFQLELGQTQLKLQNKQEELIHCQKQFFAVKNQLQKLQTEFATVKEKLVVHQDWLEQLQAKVEVVAIEKRLPKGEFDTLWGFGIATPKPQTITTGGSLLIKGWILGKRAKVNTVEIVYEGKTLLPTPVDQSSPLIAQQYPDIPKARNSGFETALSIVAMSSEAVLEVQGLLEDNTSIPICAIILKRQSLKLKPNV